MPSSVLGGELTASALQPVLDAAKSRWLSTGLTAEQAQRLAAVDVRVGDLSSSVEPGAFGLAGSSHVLIDNDAAGHGWFIDAAPDSDQFASRIGGDLLAGGDSPAAHHVDLLTVVMHELGHVLGLSDLDPTYEPDSLMTGRLGPGTRRLPAGEARALDLYGATLGRREAASLGLGTNLGSSFSSTGPVALSSLDRAFATIDDDTFSDRLEKRDGTDLRVDASDSRESDRADRLATVRRSAPRAASHSKAATLANGTGRPKPAAPLTHDEATDAALAELEFLDVADQTTAPRQNR